MKKRAEMMTLETVAEAVLVAAAFFVLIILAVGIYQLFFYDSSEQAAKESFHSLLATLDTLGDNRPILRPFKLAEEYAIMDTAVENGECFIGEVSVEGSYFSVGQNAASTKGLPLYLQALPQVCKNNDCLCLCRSTQIGLCDELIECKEVSKKSTQAKYHFFSKVDSLFMQKYSLVAAQFDSAKEYGCIYIKSFDKVYPLKIVKFDDQITFCSNECDINDPTCCTTPNYISLIDKNFAELQNNYDLCREKTVAKRNPAEYFKLLKQGTYISKSIAFFPVSAQQKAIYIYSFDDQGNLDETKLGETIRFDTPFVQMTDNLIELCKELADLNKNANLRKEFIGTDNIKRIIELGICKETDEKYYIRIIQKGGENKLLFIDNDVPKRHFDLINTNAIDLELFNDELYVIPKSEVAEKDSDQYKQVEDGKSLIQTKREQKNLKVNLNDKSSKEISLNFGIFLTIGGNEIDVSSNNMEKNTLADTIKQCDEVTDAANFGEYFFIQDANQDTTIGNNFKTIIDYGKCYYKTAEEVEAEQRKISSNTCKSGDSDCVGSTDTELNQELAIIAHNYLRIIKEDEAGNKELLFHFLTDTSQTLLDSSVDYSKYAYYFHNSELYVLEPASVPLDLFNLYSRKLPTAERSQILKQLDINSFDITKLPEQKNCNNQLIYPFFQGSELKINADGKLQLKANAVDIKLGSFNNFPFYDKNFICMLEEGKPFDFSKNTIIYTTNQKLTFVDIGIDRLCVKVE